VGTALVACGAVSALESRAPEPRDPDRQARQRQILEAYVDCIRGASAGRAIGPARTSAEVCSTERAAYRATLPAERAAHILEQFDAGAADSSRD
jgi:hypothetical protein